MLPIPCCIVTAASLALLPLSLAVGARPGSTPRPSRAPAAAAARGRDVPRATIAAHRARRPAHHGVATSGRSASAAGTPPPETSICTLADTLVTARGERSRWFGPERATTTRSRSRRPTCRSTRSSPTCATARVVEKLLADRTTRTRRSRRAADGRRGYVAGVNKWLPRRRGPSGVTDPACRGAATCGRRRAAIDLWYGVYLANLLASTGCFVKEIVDADPPSPDDPGLPEVPTAGRRSTGTRC